MNVRELIKEATVRINLVPRRQAIPGDIMETAYNLLKGIVAKYNSDNLLNFTQNSILVKNGEVTHIYDESDFLAGQNNLYFDTVEELEAYEPGQEEFENNVLAMVKSDINSVYSIINPSIGVYSWLRQDANDSQRTQQMQYYCKANHVLVRDVAKINSVYLVTPENVPYNLYSELKFVPAHKFDDYTYGSNIYTVIQKSEGEWIIQLKPGIAALARRLKINYNESIEFDLDSDLYVPDNYTELLIVALAHKLALQYPRLDDAQMNRLENEVRVLVDNVRTPKSITRMVLRSDYDYVNRGNMTQTELMGGYWF